MESHEDLHAGDDDGTGGKGIDHFDVLTYEPKEGQEKGIGDVVVDTDIWLDDGSDLLVDDGIFYVDDDAFHPLPDFHSMSSSSSSSSAAHPPSNPISATASSSTSSSSSSASWGLLEGTNNKRTVALVVPSPPQPPLKDAACVDVMEDFGYMDLIENNEFWDPSSLDQFLQDPLPSAAAAATPIYQPATPPDGEEAAGASEDLAVLFFEWLKSNRESISAVDLRRIKLRRATIECAAMRLGGGREGTKRLLMLILEWVQNYHLQRKPYDAEHHHYFENPSPSFAVPATTACTTCGYPGQWSAPHPGLSNGHLGRPPSGYYGPFPEGGVAAAALPNPQVAYGGGQYQYCSGGQSEGATVRVGASATKEARKKRMARQRRSYSHQHRSESDGGQSSHQKMAVHHHAQLGSSSAGCSNPLVQHNSGKWVYRPAPSLAPPPDRPVVQPQSYQRQMDRRQGWKHDKNLRFLLQKVLKQSDVGSLGRIVLPKKEAEMYLPELVARDGIAIAMEDIGTNRVWNMRYRFWPNNKSRMYLLENTGDFVRSNELQEGDFIVVYSDLKCGRYMIRGVKVRQQQQKQEVTKSETMTKRSGKA